MPVDGCDVPALDVREGPTMIYIEQPAFLPWLGFCEALLVCRTVALYDDVQFVERGWQNRNRVKGPGGVHWLTVPVVKRHGQLIRDARIATAFRPEQLLRTIEHDYARAPYRDEVIDLIAPSLAARFTFLSDLSRDLLDRIAAALSSPARLEFTSPLGVPSGTPGSPAARAVRLSAICRRLGETVMWAGDGTREYLDAAGMAQHDVAVRWSRYTSRHPVYTQCWERQGFTPRLSFVDAAANMGWAQLRALLLSEYAGYITRTREGVQS
jgi:hypothetical protein